MAVARDNKFELTNITSDIWMKTVGKNTVAVLGRIQARETTVERAPPPKCGNGFETGYLPFAKGHVIALELGGSDHEANVVPQFQGWQGWGDGPWRKMEVDIRSKFHGQLMLVEIGYGRTGAIVGNDQLVANYGADAIVDWDDPRIPDTFTIFICPAAGIELPKTETDKDFDATVAAMKMKRPKEYESFKLGNKMPDPDRSFWINQAALTAAKRVWQTYGSEKAEEEKDVYDDMPMTPVSVCMTEDFIEDVRKNVSDVLPTITAVEANKVQATKLITAWWGFQSQKSLKDKYRYRTAQGRRMASYKTIFGKDANAAELKRVAKARKERAAKVAEAREKGK